MIQVEESSDEDKIRFDTGGTERVIIDSTGVGIGTSSPTVASGLGLVLNGGDAQTRIALKNSTTGDASGDGVQIALVSDDLLIQNRESSGIITFQTGDAERVRLDASGKVGIGTTSPSNILHTSGTGVQRIQIDATDNNAAGAGLYMKVLNSGSLVGNATMRVDNVGNINFFNGTSSESEKMRITSAGHVTLGSGANVGTPGTISLNVGSTSSSGGLQLFAPTDVAHGINFGDAYTTSAVYAGAIEYNHASNYMRFFTAATEKLRINSSGQFLLGTTSNNSDSYKMIADLGGGAKGIDVRNVSYNADNGAFRSVPSGNTSYRFAVMLNSSNSTVGKIEVTSANTTYTTSSDYRLKENVIPLENGLDRLNQLKPVKFNWIESGQEEEGFIAHEVDEIFSDAVVGKKDAVKDDGTVSPQTMDYGRITPLLVKAIQEQQTIIEDLKTRIETLEG